MKNVKITVLLILLTLFFCGCTKIKEGYIIDKEEHTYSQTDDLVNHEYSTYIIYVQKCVEGKEATNTWHVSKKIYDTYNIGDYVTLDDVSDKTE